ncbi:hypothetical protein TUM20983_55420 [Mycobacterium antarcticum]|nr:hypothetical protein [Mycolicibacterium sp. TUM20983]GLP78432.1 hypothetical protein TUM20983_55420 [Mycolicibacterium sp. TUM20983]
MSHPEIAFETVRHSSDAALPKALWRNPGQGKLRNPLQRNNITQLSYV